MWDFVGMGREREGLEKAIVELKALKKEFWSDVRIPGKADDLNVELEKALRLADFIEIGELMARDAHDREESCGGHFRLEHQTPEGEALRHDDQFAYVSCWEYQGEDQDPVLLKEPLGLRRSSYVSSVTIRTNPKPTSTMDKNINIKVKVWRQRGPEVKGAFRNLRPAEYLSG